MKKKILNIIGKILLLLSVAFIINRLINYDIDWKLIVKYPTNVIIIIAIFIHGANIFSATFTYRDILRITANQQISQKIITKNYCKSNLYKYLPGNVMHFIGRNQIAVDAKISHVEVAMATALEMICLVVGGGIISMLCVWTYFIKYLEILDVEINLAVVIIAILLCIVLIGIVYKLRNYIKDKVLAVTKNTSIGNVIKVLIKVSSRLLINATVFMLIMYTFGLEITSLYILKTVIGLFVLSWVVGFLTPGAPGGIGIREFFMTVFLGGLFVEETLLLVLVVYRAVCILGDMISYLYAMIAVKYFIR